MRKASTAQHLERSNPAVPLAGPCWDTRVPGSRGGVKGCSRSLSIFLFLPLLPLCRANCSPILNPRRGSCCNHVGWDRLQQQWPLIASFSRCIFQRIISSQASSNFSGTRFLSNIQKRKEIALGRAFGFRNYIKADWGLQN